jgi:hypothetical protein
MWRLFRGPSSILPGAVDAGSCIWSLMIESNVECLLRLLLTVVLINGLNGPAHGPGQAGPRPEAQPKSPCGVRLGQM